MLPSLCESYFHDIAFSGRDHHGVCPRLPLELTEIRAHDLDRQVTERQVEGACIGHVGQEEAHHLSAFHRQLIIGLSINKEDVPESPHQSVSGVFLAKRKETVLGDEKVVQHEDLFSVDRIEVGRARGPDQQVAVESEVLLDVLPVVWVVPVDSGISKENPILECIPGLYRVLRHPGHTIERIIETHAVPVDGR